MENILDFIMAALPWIAIGLCWQYFLPEVPQKKENENEERRDRA